MFLQIESLVETWESDESRKAFVKHLADIDLEWSNLVKLNAVVMSLVVESANATHRSLAFDLCLSTMGLLGRMCDSWAYVSGNVIVAEPDQDQISEESKALDRLGSKLGGLADPFLGIVLTKMLVSLLDRWAQVFRSISDTKRKAIFAMSADDASAVSINCLEELREAFNREKAGLDVILSSGSYQSEATINWLKHARPRFDVIVRHWGGSEHKAMFAVIQELGLPNLTA